MSECDYRQTLTKLRWMAGQFRDIPNNAARQAAAEMLRTINEALGHPCGCGTPKMQKVLNFSDLYLESIDVTKAGLVVRARAKGQDKILRICLRSEHRGGRPKTLGTCSVRGCGKPARAAGLCKSCYRQAWKTKSA